MVRQIKLVQGARDWASAEMLVHSLSSTWFRDMPSKGHGETPLLPSLLPPTQLSCIAFRAHLERMTFHGSFLQTAKQQDCWTPRSRTGYRGSQCHGLLDPQIQMVTLTLQHGTCLSVIVPSTHGSSKSLSSPLNALSTCRNSKTEGGEKKLIIEVTKITLIEIYSL